MYFDRHRTFYICRCWRSRVQEAGGSQAGREGGGVCWGVTELTNAKIIRGTSTLPSHPYCGVDSRLWWRQLIKEIKKTRQWQRQLTKTKNNHGLAACLCWSPQSVCLCLQSVQICKQYKWAADENPDHFKLQCFQCWRIEDKTSIDRTLKSDNLHRWRSNICE